MGGGGGRRGPALLTGRFCFLGVEEGPALLPGGFCGGGGGGGGMVNSQLLSGFHKNTNNEHDN